MLFNLSDKTNHKALGSKAIKMRTLNYLKNCYAVLLSKVALIIY